MEIWWIITKNTLSNLQSHISYLQSPISYIMDCTICMESLHRAQWNGNIPSAQDYKSSSKEYIAFLPCHHCYHVDCIKPWVQANSQTQRINYGKIGYTCPKCQRFIQKHEMPYLWDSNNNDSNNNPQDVDVIDLTYD